MRNYRHYKYYYLSSIIGFIGTFLGFTTGNYYYFIWSPTFLVFVYKEGQHDDERWERNVGRAARNAILLIMVALILCMTYAWSLQMIALSPLVLPILLLVSVSGFVLYYVYYDRRGD